MTAGYNLTQCDHGHSDIVASTDTQGKYYMLASTAKCSGIISSREDAKVRIGKSNESTIDIFVLRQGCTSPVFIVARSRHINLLMFLQIMFHFQVFFSMVRCVHVYSMCTRSG